MCTAINKMNFFFLLNPYIPFSMHIQKKKNYRVYSVNHTYIYRHNPSIISQFVRYQHFTQHKWEDKGNGKTQFLY